MLRAWTKAAQPRSRLDAARSAAMLYGVGALVIALETSVVPSPGFPAPFGWVPALMAIAYAIGAVTLWRVPEQLPVLLWPFVAAIPVATILILAVSSRDSTASSQLAFCWPVLFSAYHLKPVVARFITAQVVMSEVTLCFLLQAHGEAVENSVGVSLILIGVMQTLITARDRLDASIRTLRHDAEHDAVTGLLSRRTFDADIMRADVDQPASLILVDIDNFKGVNDTYGHATGDAVLRVVSDILRANSRHADRAYRIGGDELAVFLPACGPAAVSRRAEDIRRAVESSTALAVALDGRDRRGRGSVTVSLGIASVEAQLPRHPTLLSEADAAMYRAKDGGRNRVVAAWMTAA
jgi:diguanylate cyclase (GGDEF)-like protein